MSSFVVDVNCSVYIVLLTNGSQEHAESTKIKALVHIRTLEETDKKQ